MTGRLCQSLGPRVAVGARVLVGRGEALGEGVARSRGSAVPVAAREVGEVARVEDGVG
jgi:hypothetical protein